MKRSADIPLDWPFVDGVLREHGDSVYLLDLDRFEGNLRALRSSLREYYPRTQLGYSYKTNYLPSICLAASRNGAYAEVVSRLELDLAIRLGAAPGQVIFNGPLKSIDDLRLAIERQIVVNLDSEIEIDSLAEIAANFLGPMRVGLRCNFPLDDDHCSRFGFAATDGQVDRAAARLRDIPGCELIGLHCHFSHFREPESYRRRAEELVRLSQRLFVNKPPEYLDIGGGMAGPMPEELAQQFSRRPATYEEYAAEIGGVLQDAFPGGDGPELIVEPGMAVVADCMRFATRVLTKKKIADREFVVVGGSVFNVKPTLNALNLPLEILRRAPAGTPESRADGPVDVVGFTCMEIDVLHRGLNESTTVGDILVFGNVGAYSIVLTPPFIRAAPAIVSIDSTRTLRVERRAETLDDMLQTYALPLCGEAPSPS